MIWQGSTGFLRLIRAHRFPPLPTPLCLLQIQAIDYCYFTSVSEDLKSFDIQTIYAKIGLTSGVFELAQTQDPVLTFP